MAETTTRTDTLRGAFNDFWNNVFGGPARQDYYSMLSQDQWVDLKMLLSNINNIITLRATMAFVDLLAQHGLLADPDKLKADVDSVSANANGYDVKCDDDRFSFLAEVKCNIPVKFGSYGAAQEKGIKKDIEGLLNGKKKAGLENTGSYAKFLVVLNDKDGSQSQAIKRIIAKSNGTLVWFPTQNVGQNAFSPDKVYVALVDVAK